MIKKLNVTSKNKKYSKIKTLVGGLNNRLDTFEEMEDESKEIT